MTMDRLPLVQALTSAGLERAGAEQVATALGDAIESSVATKADVAPLDGAVARLEMSFGREINRLDIAIVRLDASVTHLGADIARLEATTKAESAQLAATIRTDMSALEKRQLVRLGGMMLTVGGVLFTALHYFGHVP